MNDWEVNITVINEDAKRIHLLASHLTDGIVDFDYSLTGVISSPEQRTGMLNAIKESYLAYLTRKDRETDLLAGLADTAVNALNAWEDGL